MCYDSCRFTSWPWKSIKTLKKKFFNPNTFRIGVFYFYIMTIEQLYSIYTASSGVSTDTRSIQENNLFFALKGGNFNGNQYAEQALDQGAQYAIIDEEKFAIDSRFILVENVLATLQELAQHHRNQLKIPVIAITGSNGKTTTKELLQAAIGTFKNVFVTPGNLNNHIGVPLSILQISREIEIAVLELGDNHIKEVEGLCKIAKPDFGLVTNIGKDHLEGFGSMEMNIRAKAEIFEYLAHHNGKAFVDLNDELVNHLAQEVATTIYYTEQLKFNTVEDQLQITSDNQKYNTQLFGLYNEQNVRCAVTIALYFGGELDKVLTAISKYQPSNNRSQIVHASHNKVILDAYNANPSSVHLALKSLNIQDDTTVILGDMFELGQFSDAEHQAVVNLCQTLKIPQAIFVGNNFAKCNITSPYLTFESTEKTLSYLQNSPLQGKTILVKGSRGMALEKLMTTL